VFQAADLSKCQQVAFHGDFRKGAILRCLYSLKVHTRAKYPSFLRSKAWELPELKGGALKYSYSQYSTRCHDLEANLSISGRRNTKVEGSESGDFGRAHFVTTGQWRFIAHKGGVRYDNQRSTWRDASLAKAVKIKNLTAYHAEPRTSLVLSSLPIASVWEGEKKTLAAWMILWLFETRNGEARLYCKQKIRIYTPREKRLQISETHLGNYLPIVYSRSWHH
jgi:hypothetical protein